MKGGKRIGWEIRGLKGIRGIEEVGEEEHDWLSSSSF